MKNVSVYYDKEGDFLEIQFGKPTKGYFQDIGNDVLKRIDEKTGKVKGFAFLNATKHTNIVNIST